MAKNVLDAKRGTTFYLDPDKIFLVGLDVYPGQTKPDGPEHPLYDKRVFLPLDEELIASIDAQGVILPPIVRKNGDIPEVVAGRRRVMHGREVNRRRREQGLEPILIQVIVRKLSDKAARDIMLVENLHRADLDPIDRAEEIQRSIDLYGHTPATIAASLGVGEKAVTSWLRILECAQEVQDSVRTGGLTFSAAIALAKLPRHEQLEACQKLLAGEGRATHREAAHAAREARARAKQARQPNDPTPDGDSDQTQPQDAKSSSTPPDPDVLLPPSRRELRALLKVLKANPLVMESAVLMLEYVLGEAKPRRIKGLTDALRQVEQEKADAKQKAEDREKNKAKREEAKKAKAAEKEAKAKAKEEAKKAKELAREETAKAKAKAKEEAKKAKEEAKKAKKAETAAKREAAKKAKVEAKEAAQAEERRRQNKLAPPLPGIV